MRIPTYCLALTALLATGAVVYGHIPAGAPAASSASAAGPAAPATPAAAATAGEIVLAGPSLPASVPVPDAGGDDEAPYYAEGQFTARFEQTHNRWHLQPIDGPDRVIDAGACSTGATAPAGVWLLVHDGDGRVDLVAPSATPLVAGAPDRIALRACERASGRELAAPQQVLDLLAAGTGAIRVDR